jgi:DEAD/DEAH box helicase domain-containing protein
MRSDGYQVRLVMHSTETFAVTNLFRRGADAAVVTAIVFGYFKVDKKNNIIDAIDVDNPPVIMNTKGMWLDVPAKAVEILERKGYNVAGSIHAAEHAILSLLPNVVITSPGDVRTECKAPQKEYAKVCP